MGESAENAIEEVDDDSWVFESLVNFIHGPIWNLPVVGFIEEKCVGKNKDLRILSGLSHDVLFLSPKFSIRTVTRT